MTLVPQIMVGSSRAMQQLASQIRTIAPSPVPVLIEGPTGAGKELVAHLLHSQSGRAGRFVPLNVCAITDSMFEDALFGHVRGAFTGAVGSTTGYALEAHRGTLLLDEISTLALALQVKLLRLIETKMFRPLGGKIDVTSDFRLVAASNESLWERAGAGHFREDLLHRIAGIVLRVPALRERAEDIPLIAKTLLATFSQQLGRAVTLTDAAVRVLQSYDWPGNVRELRAVLESAATMAGQGIVCEAQIHAQLHERLLRLAGRADAIRAHGALTDLLNEHEGDVMAVAKALGVNRATVYRRLRELGIPTPRQRRTRNASVREAPPAARIRTTDHAPVDRMWA